MSLSCHRRLVIVVPGGCSTRFRCACPSRFGGRPGLVVGLTLGQWRGGRSTRPDSLAKLRKRSLKTRTLQPYIARRRAAHPIWREIVEHATQVEIIKELMQQLDEGKNIDAGVQYLSLIHI